MAVTTKSGIAGKACSTCEQWKPLEDFSPGGMSHGPSQGGRHCQCRPCNALAHRRRNAAIRYYRLMSVAKLHWKPGPKTLGCVYHPRGVYKRPAADSLVVDVFIMPRIARKRPVAVTVGRYRNYKPVSKREWQLRSPKSADGAGV